MAPDKIEESVQTDKVSSQSAVEVKEYTDEKGETVKLPVDIFTVENLQRVDINVFDKLANLKEPKAMDACRTCRFWSARSFRSDKKGNQIAIDGACRFDPPVVIQSGSYKWYSTFPPVGPYEWCGKFEPITPK